jgi:hypothetical protein
MGKICSIEGVALLAVIIVGQIISEIAKQLKNSGDRLMD